MSKLGWKNGALFLRMALSGMMTASLAAGGASSAMAQSVSVEDAWKLAVEQNTVASYTQFLIDWEDSEYAAEALRRVAVFNSSDFSCSGADEGSAGASTDSGYCLTTPVGQTVLNI